MIRPLRSLLLLALALVSGSSVAAAAPASMEGEALEQVVLLSRHNLRAPLVSSGTLAEATPHAWAKWDVAAGELTTKGGVLEVYLGRYFGQWLRHQRLLPAEGCPQAGEFHALANSLQRTQATAQFFIAGAFPGCHVVVEQRRPLGTMDPLFDPVIHRDDAGFQRRALRAMQRAETSARLGPDLQVVEAVVEHARSPACAGRSHCVLQDTDSRFRVEAGKEPGASGSLALANGMVDALLMEDYQNAGPPAGWGRLPSDAQWQALARVRNGYQDVLFGTPEVAREVAAPLLSHIDGLFADPRSPRVSLLVGHDSNIGAVLAALGAADYTLPGQLEKTPIGGLLQFERWRVHNGEARYRLAYVYPTRTQLRDALPLSDMQPPGRVELALPGCARAGCSEAQFKRMVHRAAN
ncbi:bifunctional glucose-1-phosphatase/inositol phosphatase [Stenotrophomonas sp. ESTM1D_MKCIP4_1]|uniref:bifunctional glucose-1-phosphatase/inositol phosphatase n=1 Tax=Stenotrophomonas sp. ESTM1D_MKCIP4_1 TaxID=2072414 RepID=UPI000D53F610|nr:bifunctional glucose-1-phosphatase/inositol phosphatase [Stenotrophomonas sp. ESTM1D_MKCIP4_1]AWH52828.1 bifunctional glucose-1-phosphatase/inositol phosphatase [Stenotrophomonas sp. ESTM1D_MKCIP4_1]